MLDLHFRIDLKLSLIIEIAKEAIFYIGQITLKINKALERSALMSTRQLRTMGTLFIGPAAADFGSFLFTIS